MRDLDLYRHQLGLIPGLAAAHYRWVFSDKSQLDWLLAQDRKNGWGSDSLTILALKAGDTYLGRKSSGATGELLHRAIEIRKRLYGAERFEKAWRAAEAK